MQANERRHHLLDKLQKLPPERLGEVEDFIDFLQARESDARLTHAAARATEPVLMQVWDNVENAIYDDV